MEQSPCVGAIRAYGNCPRLSEQTASTLSGDSVPRLTVFKP